MVNLDKIYTLAVLGDRNTGKTNLVFHILKEYKGNRTIYLFGYPKDRGYKQLHSLQELSQVTNGIVFMDELQNHIKLYSKRANETLLELLATIAHNKNTLVFTTPLSQFITKSFDGFIDGFLYTKISDLSDLKNGCKAKRRLLDFSHPKINKWSCNLNVGEYIEIIDSNNPEENGIKNFPNMNIAKDWATT